MGFHLFDELNTTTAAYCHALGLDATPFESPLSAEEVEIAEYMQRHGINRQAASMMLSIRNMPGPVAKMGPPKMFMHHCVIEYARTDEQIADAAEAYGRALDQYYAACRARTTIGPAFVGD